MEEHWYTARKESLGVSYLRRQRNDNVNIGLNVTLRYNHMKRHMLTGFPSASNAIMLSEFSEPFTLL